MNHATSLRAGLAERIRDAFSGVCLREGISLRQAEVIDRHGVGYTDAEFDQMKQSEIIDDWAKIPFSELERNNVAHLDAAGFRYYIPALMLSVIDRHDSSSMWMIGTLSGLNPKKEFPVWAYHLERYSLLTFEQKRAIAEFLNVLPQMVPLNNEDQNIVKRALSIYWNEFLPLHIPNR